MRHTAPQTRNLSQALLFAVSLSLGATLSADALSAPKSARKAAPQAPSVTAMIVEPQAMDLLKAVSAKLAAAKTLSFTANVGYEYPSRLGPPIVYSMRYEVTMQRPDKLRIIIPGDGPASEFYYDGKAMMAYAPVENLVAVADAPPTIDAALKAAYDNAALYFPFTDLLVADPYSALTDGVKLAFTIGSSAIVGGVKTDMLAWANDDVFLQIWIGAEDRLPRRIRAVYRADPLRLRHEMELSNWQVDGALASETFTSPRALAAPRIAFKNPAPAQPPGMKPLLRSTPAKAAAKAP